VLAEKAYQHEKARKEQAKRAHGAVLCEMSSVRSFQPHYENILNVQSFEPQNENILNVFFIGRIHC